MKSEDLMRNAESGEPYKPPGYNSTRWKKKSEEEKEALWNRYKERERKVLPGKNRELEEPTMAMRVIWMVVVTIFMFLALIYYAFLSFVGEVLDRLGL